VLILGCPRLTIAMTGSVTACENVTVFTAELPEIATIS